MSVKKSLFQKKILKNINYHFSFLYCLIDFLILVKSNNVKLFFIIMCIDRVVMGVAGIFVMISCLLGFFVSDLFFYLAFFVGFMLFQASITKFCPMAWIVKKLGGKSEGFF